MALRALIPHPAVPRAESGERQSRAEDDRAAMLLPPGFQLGELFLFFEIVCTHLILTCAKKQIRNRVREALLRHAELRSFLPQGLDADLARFRLVVADDDRDRCTARV